MPLTVYSDVIMPNSVIAAGVRGKNIRMNERARNNGGYDSVNVIWSKTLRQFELGTVPMVAAQWQALEGLYEITDAGAYGFLMEDPKDSSISASEGLLQPILSGVAVGTIGLGYGIPDYQINKRYSSVGTTRTKDRIITRPKSAISVLRGGIAGSATVNYNTGLVTFNADTSQAMSSITVGASTVLNFSSGAGIVAALAVGQRVYLSGIAGTAAATLNTKSHVITAKGATSLTISTATTGLTATTGTAYKYPQASEALTCSGSFYVPVHFMEDEIDWELLSGGQRDSRLLAGPSVVLIEVRE